MEEDRKPVVKFRREGRVVIGVVHESRMLSATNVSEFGRQVLAHVAENPGLNLLLSFESVDYLSSAVLTELLRVHRAIENCKGQLRLCAVRESIREVFTITNLDTVFVVQAESVDVDLPRFERSLDIAAQEDAWKEPS